MHWQFTFSEAGIFLEKAFLGFVLDGVSWNADQMTGRYLATLPRQFMREMADFESDFSSSHFLPRETIL